MPRKKTEITETEYVVGSEPEVDDGLAVAHFPDVIEEEAAKEYRHARLPKDLIPFVEYSDKFFSATKQQAMAEKRKAAVDETASPRMITSGIDLLILEEKRREAPSSDKYADLCPPFSVGAFSSSDLDNYYERKLEKATSWIESMLYLEDAEGKTLTGWAVAQRLKAAGIPFPEKYREYAYLLENPHGDFPANSQSYWSDADKYSHLWQLRHRSQDAEFASVRDEIEDKGR